MTHDNLTLMGIQMGCTCSACAGIGTDKNEGACTICDGQGFVNAAGFSALIDLVSTLSKMDEDFDWNVDKVREAFGKFEAAVEWKSRCPCD